ncbi:hypothetical protein GCM10027290_61860 [Micromonospora sonneratiae]|uniref:Tetratricopeptide repeat-containing protein n=1 Tax=Micromonospora sonneratiae TaxID=1184706 RepID=A0ABW3YRJ7_9ACTN
MSDAERIRRAAVCRDAWEALCAGDRQSATDQLGRLVAAPPGAPYLAEAAFLLALAQVDGGSYDPLRGCATALRQAAETAHPVYAPAAKMLLARHCVASANWALAARLWEELARPELRGYNALAWFGLAGLHQRAQEPDQAREAMHRVWSTGDFQFAPRALGWLISHHADNGDTTKAAWLAKSAFGGWGDPLIYDRITLISLHTVVGRSLLHQVIDPQKVLTGAELLAEINAVREEPLARQLARDLGHQPVPMDGVDLPWYEPYLRNQPDATSLHRVAHEALAYADVACGLAAIPYVEGDRGPGNAFEKIVHQAGRYEWGPIMTASIRHRMLSVLGAPDDFIPATWADPPSA